MKISFDFDDTLDRQSVQSFAKWCIRQGHEVWIVTSRYPDEYWADKNVHNWVPNADLWDVAAALKIHADRVVFTGMTSKASWFSKHPDFTWHLDDCHDEIHEACQMDCPVPFVNSKGSWWMKQCKNFMQEKA